MESGLGGGILGRGGVLLLAGEGLVELGWGNHIGACFGVPRVYWASVRVTVSDEHHLVEVL
jgi:hypothetical protein